VYPEQARQARIQGTVIVQITVGTDGRVSNARVIRSIPMLDQAALDAVKQWVYDPSAIKAPVTLTVSVPFGVNAPPAAAVQPTQPTQPSQTSEAPVNAPVTANDPFRSDPKLLDKLYRNQVKEIGTDTAAKADLAVVQKAFEAANARMKNSSEFTSRDLIYVTKYFSDPEVALIVMTGWARHPAFLRTTAAIQASGGPDSEWSQTVLRNYLRLVIDRGKAGR
jgi:TonB family protein